MLTQSHVLLQLLHGTCSVSTIPGSRHGQDHWKIYGRNYYCRYDYEGVESDPANTMMKNLTEKCATLKGTEMKGMKVESAENFEYNDPVDKSVSANQGIKNLSSIWPLTVLGKDVPVHDRTCLFDVAKTVLNGCMIVNMIVYNC